MQVRVACIPVWIYQLVNAARLFMFCFLSLNIRKRAIAQHRGIAVVYGVDAHRKEVTIAQRRHAALIKRSALVFPIDGYTRIIFIHCLSQHLDIL